MSTNRAFGRAAISIAGIALLFVSSGCNEPAPRAAALPKVRPAAGEARRYRPAEDFAPPAGPGPVVAGDRDMPVYFQIPK
jgi:hypothetical protein